MIVNHRSTVGSPRLAGTGLSTGQKMDLKPAFTGKFAGALPVAEVAQNGQVRPAKVTALGVDLSSQADLAGSWALDLRQGAAAVLWGRVKARLAAGEPVILPADPFLPYRGPAPSERVTLLMPLARSARP